MTLQSSIIRIYCQNPFAALILDIFDVKYKKQWSQNRALRNKKVTVFALVRLDPIRRICFYSIKYASIMVITGPLKPMLEIFLSLNFSKKNEIFIFSYFWEQRKKPVAQWCPTIPTFMYCNYFSLLQICKQRSSLKK